MVQKMSEQRMSEMIDVKVNSEQTITLSVEEAKKIVVFMGSTEESVTLYDSHCMERDAAGVPCVKCGYKTPEESIDGFGKCDDCCDLADYEEEEEDED